MINVLFVCTGNICRSPTAEGVFRHLVKEAGLEGEFHIASAGTESYHEGEAPDARAIKIAYENGVSLHGQQARGLARGDFNEFDYIFAMDGGHFFELHRRAPKERRARIHMFLEELTHVNTKEVPDPWYGDEQDFKHVFGLVNKGAQAILQKIRQEHNL